MCAAGPIDFVGDLVAGRDPASGAVLQAEIRKAVGVDLRNAVALRPHARIKSDRGRVDARVSSFLKLTESIPTQAESVNQARIEQVNLADRKVVGQRRRHAKPGIQLRAAARTGSAARKFVLAFAMEISCGERIGVRDSVINLQNTAVRSLAATIVDDERARETE